MTFKPIMASVGLVALAVAGFYFWSVPEPLEPEASAPTQPIQAKLEPAEEAAPKPGVLANEPSPVNPDENLPKHDPVTQQLIDMVNGKLPEMELVEGIWVKVDRNCTVRIHGYTTNADGTQTPIYSCDPDNPPPVDIYTTYSNDELKTMSYYDPKASYQLTMRLHEADFSLATDYALRATALADDGKYIATMMNMNPGPARVDGKISLEYIERGYVLSGVAAAYDSGFARAHENYVRDVNRHEAEGIDIPELDSRIADMLEKIENVKVEVGTN